MDFTFIIITTVLIVTLVAPVFSYYAIKKARQKDFKTHKKIQTIVYAFCIAAVLVLELLIRFSGGSGSMFKDSSHADNPVFKTILIAHIIGAVLTYIVWTFLIIKSVGNFKNTSRKIFSDAQKTGNHCVYRLGLHRSHRIDRVFNDARFRLIVLNISIYKKNDKFYS